MDPLVLLMPESSQVRTTVSVRPVARSWVLEKIIVGFNDLDLLLPFLETLDIAVYTAESRKELFYLVAEDTVYCLKWGKLG